MAGKKILYATDYSETSQQALHFASSLARAWDATLLIAHVSEEELYPVGEAFDEDPQPNPEAVARLHAVVPDDPQVPCEHRLLFAPPSSANVKPADEIVKCAQEEGVEAIVMGTHGWTGLGRLLAGSVAESVLRQAPCPVVTIKQPAG